MTSERHVGETFYAQSLEVRIFETAQQMGACAAAAAAALMNDAIARNGAVRVVVATGASQFPFYEAFNKAEIDWSACNAWGVARIMASGALSSASWKLS